MATMTLTRCVPVTESLNGEYLEDSDKNIYFLSVEQEEDPLNPRDDGNLAHMVCWHNRYNLGDKHDFDCLDDVIDQLESEKKSGDDYVSSPLFLLDHSGLSISIHDFNDRWDSGFVGIAYIKKSDLINDGIALSDDWKTDARKIIESEVSLYDQYLRGEVYGYRLFQLMGDHWEEIDSCWGFFGSDIHENGMMEQIGLDKVVIEYDCQNVS